MEKEKKKKRKEQEIEGDLDMFNLLVSLSPFAGADEPGYGVTGLAVAKLAGGIHAPAPEEKFYNTMGGPLSLPCTRHSCVHNFATKQLTSSKQLTSRLLPFFWLLSGGSGQ